MGTIALAAKSLLLAYAVQILSLVVLTTITLVSISTTGTNRSPKIQSIFGDDVVDSSKSADRGPPVGPHQRKIAPYEIKSCLSPDLQVHEEATCRFFVIMFDAGSTGTRMHIFEFSHDINNKAALFKLEREVFHEVSPGLSSYLNNPQEAAKSVVSLLEKAKLTVAESQWMHTPIALKATAGLRLLNFDKAERIIDEVDRLFHSSGFLTNEESVSIMTGVDEGIFGWFTLNFLLQRLEALKQPAEQDFDESEIHHLTAAALDLGGGSTQVTFRPRRRSSLIEAPEEFIKQIRLFGQTIDVYTHSYLGNGLVDSRLSTLKMTNPPQQQKRPLAAENHFTTSCLPHNVTVYWVYHDVIYTVSGQNRTYDFDHCLTEQELFIKKSAIDRPRELASRDIYLFGYYYDRAVQSGLLTVGGRVTLGQFERAARRACLRRRLGDRDYERWMCRDLVYITLLLRSYGIPDDKPLHLTKKLKNMEVSWALGASYHLLNTYHESRKAGHNLKMIKPAGLQQQRRPANSDANKFVGPQMPIEDQILPTDDQQSVVPVNYSSGPCDDIRTDYQQQRRRDNDRRRKPTGGGVMDNLWLNLGAFYVCSRVYYGLLSLMPIQMA